MRVPRILSIVFVIAIATHSSMAAWPDNAFQGFSRWMGYGYGDGYHACNPKYPMPPLPAVPAIPSVGGHGCGSCCQPRFSRFGACCTIDGCSSCVDAGSCGGGCASGDCYSHVPKGISPGHFQVRYEPPVYGTPEIADSQKDQKEEGPTSALRGSHGPAGMIGGSPHTAMRPASAGVRPPLLPQQRFAPQATSAGSELGR